MEKISNIHSEREYSLSYINKILESSIDGIFAFDQEFKITLWNKQMERFSGLNQDLCLGKPAFELFPLLKKLYGLSLQKVFKGRTCILKGMPFNPTLNNGLEEYYEGYYSPIHNDKNEVTGILGIIREIGYRPAFVISEENPEEDEIHDVLLKDLTLEDVFSVEELQRIQNSFSMATGVGSVIVDQKGRFITSPTNFTNFCNAESPNKHIECKKHLQSIWSAKSDLKNPTICRTCNLPQFYAPIMLGKKQLALWIIGQVKISEAPPADPKKSAKNLGVSIEDYLEGYKKTPYISSDKFSKIGELLQIMAFELSNFGLRSFQQDKDDADRKQITSQLININNRREELARIINKSPAIAFLWKVGHGRPVSFVSENINQFGYRQEDFQSGRIKFSDIVYKEDLYTLEFELQEYLLTSKENNFTKEYRIITKHGGMRWVQERSWPRIDEKGKIVYLEGLLVDVSVKKFAEEALIASEEQFKLLFERAPIGMALLSINGEILRINKAFSELIGYSFEKLLNFKFEKFIHSGDVSMFIEGDNAIMVDNVGEYQVENRFVKSNGEILYSITKIALIFDAKGKPYQKLVQIVDITNRKKAENDLLSSQSKLQQAQSFAHLGNWELDINSSQIQASDEVFNIYGYEKGNDLKTLDDFLQPVTPHYKDVVKKSFYEFIKGSKKELNEEYKIVRNYDGKILAVHTKAEMVLNELNQPIIALGTIQDITERKSTEEELKTRNDELTNFVYKVSHDLRSPLLSISGLINLIRTSEMDTDQQKYISLIEGRVKKLDTFIMDILSHSKNLYTDIHIEKIDFHTIINSAFHDLAYLENSIRIQKQVNIPKKDFYSDQQRLMDIFRNLISNAIQYLHPSKKINTISIDISISERYASIVIEDNGLGIEKSVIPKIFNMFYRGVEISHGSGIGLYIVKQAVEKLGGNISVESTISVGSKFFITLPNLVDKKGSTFKML